MIEEKGIEKYMKNTLQVGMEFDNMIELCAYVGWEYSYQHSARLGQKLGKYVDFHRENRHRIIIDKIKNPNIEPINFKLRRKDYDYSVGDIIDVRSGQVEILELTYKITTNGTRRKAYKAKCLKCGYVYTDYDYIFYKGVGCGCCNNKVVVKGKNDIWTTNPNLGKLLANKEDGYKYTENSEHKVDWICPICHTVNKQKAINNISKRGLNCICHKTKSYPNRFMYYLLNDLEIGFEDEKTFTWSEKKRYDFYIPSLKAIIEMHGNQHYYENYSFTKKSLLTQQNNDNYKKELAIDNGISYYFEINSSQSDFNYIKNNVLKSELGKILPFSEVNWERIRENCEKNVIYEIAKCWNKGIYLAEDIGNIVGLSKPSVRKFLNRCQKFGLIEKYDKTTIYKNRDKKARSSYYQNYSKPIKCNENGMYFGSITICANKMEEITGNKFQQGSIIKTITGTYSHHHHYTFSYISREEFNSQKINFPDRTFGDLFVGISVEKDIV